MRFSNVLALSILSFANDNKGQAPTNILAGISSLTEKEFAEILADQLPRRLPSMNSGLTSLNWCFRAT
jgi:hypothetical protein